MVVSQTKPAVNPQLDNFFGRPFGHFFNVDAALGRKDDDVGLTIPVGRNTDIKLLLNVGGLFDENLIHCEAAQVHAENALRLLIRTLRIVGKLDAAGFAPASDRNLRFDDDPSADFLGNLLHLVRSRRKATVGHGQTCFGKNGFRLTFNEIQLCEPPSPSTRTTSLPMGIIPHQGDKRKLSRPGPAHRNNK